MTPKNPTRPAARHPLTDDEADFDLFDSCASCGCSSCRSDLEDGEASRAPHGGGARSHWRHSPALRPSHRAGA